MWSILVGAVVLFAFGALWFTVLFGRTWAKLMDFNPAGDEKARKMGMTKPLIVNFFLNLIIASVLYKLFPQLLSVSFLDFVKSVLLIWLGFSFPIYANAAVWERKTWTLVAINSAQSVIAFILLSSIIYFMQ